MCRLIKAPISDLAGPGLRCRPRLVCQETYLVSTPRPMLGLILVWKDRRCSSQDAGTSSIIVRRDGCIAPPLTVEMRDSSFRLRDVFPGVVDLGILAAGAVNAARGSRASVEGPFLYPHPLRYVGSPLSLYILSGTTNLSVSREEYLTIRCCTIQSVGFGARRIPSLACPSGVYASMGLR